MQGRRAGNSRGALGEDWNSKLGSFGYVRCLRTFLSLGDLELDLITLLQALVSLRADCTVVNKYVRPIVASDEPVSFGVIEPLHGSFQTVHEPLLSDTACSG